MDRDTAKIIATRAIAFAGTFLLSLAIVTALPSARARRQRYFAYATVDGSLARMQFLHFVGANVNTYGDCCTPLFLAAGEGRLQAVRYLLDEGADVNAREKFGDTALTEAAYNGQLAVAKELLIRAADVNAIGQEGTALDVAITRNNTAVADLLKHHGGKRACEIRRCG